MAQRSCLLVNKLRSNPPDEKSSSMSRATSFDNCNWSFQNFIPTWICKRTLIRTPDPQYVLIAKILSQEMINISRRGVGYRTLDLSFEWRTLNQHAEPLLGPFKLKFDCTAIGCYCPNVCLKCLLLFESVSRCLETTYKQASDNSAELI